MGGPSPPNPPIGLAARARKRDEWSVGVPPGKRDEWSARVPPHRRASATNEPPAPPGKRDEWSAGVPPAPPASATMERGAASPGARRAGCFW